MGIEDNSLFPEKKNNEFYGFLNNLFWHNSLFSSCYLKKEATSCLFFWMAKLFKNKV